MNIQVFLEGLLLQASLIFALGPQNLFVLEAGFKREHHYAVSVVCFLCDLALIMLGVAGAASFFTHFPQLKIFFGVVGVGFLIYYGFGKICNKEEDVAFSGVVTRNISLKKSILKAAAFSLINPHAYLDGIVLIGGYSAKYSILSDRLTLGMGAATFSLIWFLFLSTSSSIMMPLFQSPKRMRWVMGTAGFVLLFLSAKLGVDVYHWAIQLNPDITIALNF